MSRSKPAPASAVKPAAAKRIAVAKFGIGQVMRHRSYAIRGMVFDVDARFTETELTHSMLLVDPQQDLDEPFYYLFVQHEKTPFVAYVPERSLEPDASGEPISHPHVEAMFVRDERGTYRWRGQMKH